MSSTSDVIKTPLACGSQRYHNKSKAVSHAMITKWSGSMHLAFRTTDRLKVMSNANHTPHSIVVLEVFFFFVSWCPHSFEPFLVNPIAYNSHMLPSYLHLYFRLNYNQRGSADPGCRLTTRKERFEIVISSKFFKEKHCKLRFSIIYCKIPEARHKNEWKDNKMQGCAPLYCALGNMKHHHPSTTFQYLVTIMNMFQIKHGGRVWRSDTYLITTCMWPYTYWMDLTLLEAGTTSAVRGIRMRLCWYNPYSPTSHEIDCVTPTEALILMLNLVEVKNQSALGVWIAQGV